MKRNPIDELKDNIWFYCVNQKPPKNKETIKRWQTDEIVHLKERFIITPVPEKIRPIIEKALSHWDKIENNVLTELKMNRDEFLTQFEKTRKNFLAGSNTWKNFVLTSCPAVKKVVKNMDWANLFSWILPFADRNNIDKYKKIGKMVVAIFYLELLCKKLFYQVDKSTLNKIEARWKLLNDL